MLPKGLRDISAVLPTTHALDSLRKLLILNSNLDSILSELYILICFSVVSLLTGIFLLRLGFKYARIKGSLSSY
jgi:ABC-type multidrug transport system permease subunit